MMKNQVADTSEQTESNRKAGRERGAECSNDSSISNDDDEVPVEWAEEIDMDELISDAQEYDFNTQVEEALAAYMDDEMLEETGSSEGGGMAACCRATDECDEMCAIENGGKRQKCPGQKRRIITVTQWDASARRQMIRQLGQHGVP